ncbi:MAG: 1-acyl-sn-glycerol-3-phosphate acyltransferase [Gammaproteobacteria bacterium]|nr:1-acyl-sn-glycerol-3-phosphate acyltransferase [Gammaproteobacteria bacterium]
MLKAIKNIFLLPLIWLFILVLSIVLYILSHLPRSYSGRYYHYLSRFWCKIFVRGLDVDLRLVHQNEQPLPEHFILIANHPSALEDFGVPSLFDVYPLAKAEVRKWIVLGRISDYAGTIYVKRGSASSRHAALQSLVDAVKAGKNIVIFPEGGCKGSRIHTEFKTGAFDVSLQTGVPIVPAFLHYIDQETFEWTDESLVLKLWQIFKTNNNQVNYYVHDALSPDSFTNKESYAKHAHSAYLQWQDEYLGKI